MYVPRLYKIAKKDKKGLNLPSGALVKSFIKDNNLLLKSAGIGAGIGAVGGGTVGVVIELLKALGRRMGGLRDNNIAPLILSGLLKGGFIGAGFGGLAGLTYPTIKSVKKVKGLVDEVLKSPGYKTIKDALNKDVPKDILKNIEDIQKGLHNGIKALSLLARNAQSMNTSIQKDQFYLINKINLLLSKLKTTGLNPDTKSTEINMTDQDLLNLDNISAK